MFERLFKKAGTVQRYLEAPLPDGRLRYLEHCAQRDFSQRTLRQIACHQVDLVRILPLEPAGRVRLAELEHAGERWNAERGGRPGRKRQRAFVGCATGWLRFLGRLECPAPPAVPLADELAAFADGLRERGLSPESIRNYCSRTREFLRLHCGEARSLEEIAVEDIDRALARKAAQGVARRTMAAYAGALRAFFRDAEGRGRCRAGLAATIPLPRLYAGEGVPAGPSWEEVRRVVASADGDRPKDIRDRAILLLPAVYGLRSGEVRILRLDDIDWDRETLRVRRPKSGRTHRHPLSRTVGDAVLRYLREARPTGTRRELFLSLQAPARPLGAGCMWRVAGPRLRSLGIATRRCGPHALRHACAQRLLDQGFSLKQIGDCLGHRHPDSTAVYAKVGLSGLREVAAFDWEGLP